MTRFFLIVFSSIAFVSCQSKNEKLIIATASNMQFAMEEIIDVFTKQTGIECEMIVGSSGKLATQIKEGAPFDVFISADIKYPVNLYTSGITTQAPIAYAQGKLVLWSVNKDIQPSMHSLSTNKITHIAIANPEIAPYGKAAMQTITDYRIDKELNNKLVYGESVSQTNQFIVSGSVEIGFTSKSTVLSSKMKNKGNWIEIPDSSYSIIEQAAVIIQKSDESNKTAHQFLIFLLSNDAKKVLEDFGYEIPKYQEPIHFSF